MSEYLLVVEGLAAFGGGDLEMSVNETDYKAAMFGLVFTQPVHGYVWCDTHHDWVRSDEAMVCDRCLEDYYAKLEREADESFGDCDPGCPVHKCSSHECACASKFAATLEFGEDVDFAQADMLYRDAEASWYRFMVA